MNSFFLSEGDFSRLHDIYHNESRPPIPSPEQRRLIGKILAASSVEVDPDALEKHVGFDDEVILRSIVDDKDDFVMRIVPPSEADPGQDKISILTPVSLAVIARPKGSVVTWEANGGIREMKIAAIRKSAALQIAGI